MRYCLKRSLLLSYNCKTLKLLFLYKVQNSSKPVLYFVKHHDGVFTVLIFLLFKENNSLLYKFAILY